LPGGVCYFRTSPLRDDKIKTGHEDALALGYTPDNFPSHLDPHRWPEEVPGYRDASIPYSECIEALGNILLDVIDKWMLKNHPEIKNPISLKQQAI
jgi:isopenicillin N synthase-like dioxygenase